MGSRGLDKLVRSRTLSALVWQRMAPVVAAQIEVSMLLSCSGSFGAHRIFLARAVGFGSGSWNRRPETTGIEATVLSRLHRHETECEMRDADQASSWPEFSLRPDTGPVCIIVSVSVCP